jgi:hypothetical protein
MVITMTSMLIMSTHATDSKPLTCGNVDHFADLFLQVRGLPAIPSLMVSLSPALSTPTEVVVMSSDVTGAVRSALAELDLIGADQGAVALAWKLAEAIDVEESGRTLAELSSRLLQTLESLGATPAARKAIAKGVPTDGNTGSDLDDLRARRASRKDRAAAVDSASS